MTATATSQTILVGPVNSSAIRRHIARTSSPDYAADDGIDQPPGTDARSPTALIVFAADPSIVARGPRRANRKPARKYFSFRPRRAASNPALGARSRTIYA
jgi:hypothetical protein